MSILWLGDADLKSAVSEKADRNEPVLFYWWTPSVFVDPKKYMRVHMPDCLKNSYATGVTSNSAVNCDFPQQQLAIYVWPELHKHAAEAHSFLKKMTVSNFEMQHIFDDAIALSLGRSSASDAELEAAACSWLKTHQQDWLGWIPPPKVCTTDDYKYEFSDCNGDDRTISFVWKFPSSADSSIPSNCKGGIKLPRMCPTFWFILIRL
jgi:gamma-aminobutyric acid type B receptor